MCVCTHKCMCVCVCVYTQVYVCMCECVFQFVRGKNTNEKHNNNTISVITVNIWCKPGAHFVHNLLVLILYTICTRPTHAHSVYQLNVRGTSGVMFSLYVTCSWAERTVTRFSVKREPLFKRCLYVCIRRVYVGRSAAIYKREDSLWLRFVLNVESLRSRSGCGVVLDQFAV